MQTYPRKLTTRSGTARWQGRSGRTYDTYDEADLETDSVLLEEKIEAATDVIAKNDKKSITWASALFQLVFGGGLLFTIILQLVNDEIHFKNIWMWIGLPIGLFFLAGILLQGAVELWALVTGQRDRVKPEAISGWWNERVGCSLLIGAAGLAACFAAYLAIASVFDGVDKGTAMIVVLLFAILIAVLGRSSNQR